MIYKSLVLLSFIFLFSCNTLKNALPVPTVFETTLALKEVLNSSAIEAIKTLNSLKNGEGGAIPKEISLVMNTMKTLGMGEDITKVTSGIEDASRIVAHEGTAIMKDAIQEVSFTDAASIVIQGEDAATSALKKAMYKTVTKRYEDRLAEELAKTDAPKFWSMAKNAYNIFAKEKIDDSLSGFLAKRAVDATFIGMGAEESNIRKNYKSMGNKVVSKVFDYYKNKKS